MPEETPRYDDLIRYVLVDSVHHQKAKILSVKENRTLLEVVTDLLIVGLESQDPNLIVPLIQTEKSIPVTAELRQEIKLLAVKNSIGIPEMTNRLLYYGLVNYT